MLESLKIVSSANEGPPKKYQNEDFPKNGRKNFPGYTTMRKRRKCFALFARKQREKNPFASGRCINFQHSTLKKHAVNSNHKVALQDAQLRGQFTRVRVRVRVSRHSNSAIV